MIPCIKKNKLFLADSLPIKYPRFYRRFSQILNKSGINFELLTPTNDVWAVDFMPIQIAKDKFVRFVYQPDYISSPSEKKSISDVELICSNLGIQPIRSKLIVDGGNIVNSNEMVIMCDKIFRENRHLSEKEVIKELNEKLEIDKIIFLPQDSLDEIGHADGMARFLDNDTVLINDLSKESRPYQNQFENKLKSSGLACIRIPYNPYQNSTNHAAHGVYINFLWLGDKVFVPQFQMKEDEQVMKQFESLFRGKAEVIPVLSNEIARNGGVLNCVSWGIMEKLLN